MGSIIERPNDEYSSDYLSSYGDIMNKYSLVHRESGGQLIILQSKQDRSQKLMKTLTSIDEGDFYTMKNTYIEKQKLQNQNLLQIQDIFEQDEKQFCSTSYSLQIVFDFVSDSLMSEISERKIMINPFEENNIWSILTGSVTVLAYLQKNSIYHQNLSPGNIYLDEHGLIKIADPIFYDQISNYGKILMDREENNKNIYLSPILVKSFKQQNFNPKHLVYKSDVFTLGMIILHCVHLESCNQCYDYQRGEFNNQELNDKLRKLEHKGFSDNLINIIRFMLQIEQRERPDFIELENYIIRQRERSLNSTQNNIYIAEVVQSQVVDKEEYEVIKRAGKGHHKPIENVLQSMAKDEDSNSSYLTSFPAISSYIKKQIPDVRQNINLIQSSQFQDIEIEFQDEYVPVYLSRQVPTSYQLSPQVANINNYSNQKITDSYYQELPYENSRTNIEDIFNKYSQNNFKSQVDSRLSTQQNQTYAQYTGSKLDGAPQRWNVESQFISSYIPERQIVVETYSDGSRYEGEILNGYVIINILKFVKKHGKGILIYPGGGSYEGDWKYNKMHGFGALKHSSGQPAYIGDWFEDQFQGFGTLYNDNPQGFSQPFDYRDFNKIQEFWDKYEGQFKEDFKEGAGTLFLSNGEKIRGQFYRDFINGKCTFTNIEGQKIQGEWDHNVLVE